MSKFDPAKKMRELTGKVKRHLFANDITNKDKKEWFISYSLDMAEVEKFFKKAYKMFKRVKENRK